MIIGVPDAQELEDTATAWLNLGWEIAVNELMSYNDALEALLDDVPLDEVDKHWTNARFKLNNAYTLLQQALEIALKARIARVSPFLLISGDVQSWPKPNKSGEVDFSDFRTLDAAQLCRACSVVSLKSVPQEFVQFYDETRKARNKIAHLNAANVEASADHVLQSILFAQSCLYPLSWTEFRGNYVGMEDRRGPKFDGAESSVNERLCREFEVVSGYLDKEHLRAFFDYDATKPTMHCFNCNSLRPDWSDREWAFAQKQRNKTIRCPVCLKVYSQADYARLVEEAAKASDEKHRT